MKHHIQSDAFRRAAQRSEQYRIIGLTAVFAIFVVIAAVSSMVQHDRKYAVRFVEYLGFWVVCIGFESVMLWFVRRAIRKERPLHAWYWILNTIFECSLPSVAILGLTGDQHYMGPYRALVSSTVVVYSFFIILSTLRLSPALSILSGFVCAVGYLAVYLFTIYVAPDHHNNIMPTRTYVLYPILLFTAGLIAAGVAWEIRRHVVAALTEVETKRKLDRIEYDLRTARAIQQGLLPKNPPAVPGYDIAGWSEPADQTGGDYYDWIELPGGRVLFTIADATGHGIGPALLVAACRAYFRAIATRNDPLEQITAQVDALITADVPDGRFITAAVALLDPAAHTLSLYSAGQAPLYLFTAADNRVTTFDADQPPLGASFDADGSHARVLPLAPGDALVLVTDGFFECTNAANEQLGIARVADAIRQRHAAAGAALIRGLHDDVLAHTQGRPQADDLTAVVIKRSAPPAASAASSASAAPVAPAV